MIRDFVGREWSRTKTQEIAVYLRSIVKCRGRCAYPYVSLSSRSPESEAKPELACLFLRQALMLLASA